MYSSNVLLKACVFLTCFSNVLPQFQLYLREGDSCGYGTCTFLRNCPSAINLISYGGSPQICSFRNIYPIVCCEKQSSPIIDQPQDYPSPRYGRVYQRKCAEYANLNIQARNFEPAIVGGTNANLGEFTHMALIGYGPESSISWQCGGSLISERYVLTAAHCLYARQYGEARYVRIGDLNIATNNEGARPQEFYIIQRISHPDYRPPSQYNDIALLRLHRNVQFGGGIRPACLHGDFSIPTASAIATGWGATGFGEDGSNTLMKVTLDLYSPEQCYNSYRNADRRVLGYGVLRDLQLCAGSATQERDTCQGDSGGPLQIYNDNFPGTKAIIGITSLGRGCGIVNSPGIYTRVSSYVPWIERIVWGA